MAPWVLLALGLTITTKVEEETIQNIVKNLTRMGLVQLRKLLCSVHHVTVHTSGDGNSLNTS